MRRFLILLGALGALGCGGSSTAPTSVYGTYTLQTINGSAPPTVIYASGGESISVLSGSVTIRNEGTFSWTRHEHFTGAGSGAVDSDATEDGTYTQSGNDLVLTYESCCNVYTYVATWSSNRLTLTDAGQGGGFIPSVYVFSR